MNIRLLLTYTSFFFLCFSSESSAAEIVWKLYLKNSGSLITTVTNEGEPFILDYGEITSTVSGSEEILGALDGTSFVIMQSPVASSLTLHIILNIGGNSFDSIQGVALCFNMEIEAYVNGRKEDNENLFQNSPLVLTIPSVRYLSELSNCNRTEIAFGYYPGGKFEQDGIETVMQVSGIVTYINRLSNVIGGKSADLGFSSSVNYSTWYKIKKLFE